MLDVTMAITLINDQLSTLLESLQGNPQLSVWHEPHFQFVGTTGGTVLRQMIRGEIFSRLSSVITDYDFIVDSWPEYKAVVVRVNPQRAKFRGHLGRIVSAYTKDKHVLEKLLRTPGILDWSYNFRFTYLSPITRSVVEKLVCEQQKFYTVHNFVHLRATTDTLKVSSIPDGCMVTKVRLEQAGIVYTTFPYRNGKETEDYIKHILEHLPSCCMYNKEGDLVGYAVQYHTQMPGMLFVYEKERRKGYGKVIVSHLAASCLKQEKEVSVIVCQNNTSSIRLHESIGFQKVPLTKCAELWLKN